jgi:hypothetical protein
MAAEQRLRESASGVRLKIDAAIAQRVQVGLVDAQARILYLGATTDSSNTDSRGAARRQAQASHLRVHIIAGARYAAAQ